MIDQPQPPSTPTVPTAPSGHTVSEAGPGSPRRRGTGPVAITTAILGGVALLAVGASAASGAVGSRGGTSESGVQSVSARGITELDLEVGAASFTLAYGPVTEAELTVTGAQADRVELRRERGALVVSSPDQIGGSCWFGFCPPERRLGSSTITLTLPQKYRTQLLDADITLAAGAVSADGTFGQLDVEVGAGKAEVTGAARELDVSVGVGEFVGDLQGVRTADFEVSMGGATARLRGTAPDEVSVQASMGSVDLTLPDAEYRVTSAVELGDLRNELRTSSTSPHRITAELTAGDLVLRSGS